MIDETKTPNPAEPVMVKQPQYNIFNEVIEPTEDTTTPSVPAQEPENEVVNDDGLWQPEEVKESNPAEPEQSNSVDEYFNTISFNDEATLAKMQKAMEENDVGLLSSTIDTQLRKVYQKAILDAHKLLENRVRQTEQRLQKDTETRMSARDAIATLNKEVPFTANPVYEPVARSVYGQYLRKGLTPNEAVSRTKKYFEGLASSVNSGNIKPKINDPIDKKSSASLYGSSLEDLFN